MFNQQYNIGTPLTGNPSPLSPTFPAIQDYSSSIKKYGNSVLNGIKFSNNKLNNHVSGVATPEQVSNLSTFNNKIETTPALKSSEPNFKPKNDINSLNADLQAYKSRVNKGKKIGKAIGTGLKNIGNSTYNLLNNPIFGETFDIGNQVFRSLMPQAEDKGSQIAGQVTDSLGDVAGVIPGFGPILKLGLKGLSTVITSVGPNVKGNTDKEFTDRSSSFGGLGKLDSKKFGLFGIGKGRRYRDKVNEREGFRNQSEDILYSANLDREANAGSIQNLANKYHLMMNGGWQQTNGIRAGKSGMKYDLSFAHSVLKAQENNKIKDTQKFQIGGKMNVIPEGALHARKNNMDDSFLDGKITKKGIPVMHNDGGELKQVAEIEKNEIIFTKEVTEKLEELRDKGTDEAAIEAGKLLVKEILYNTEDNTGLLKIVM